jgi:hypothetical protein
MSLYPNSTRIQYYFEPIRPREELTSYMENQSGKMVVTGRCIPERLPPPFPHFWYACGVMSGTAPLNDLLLSISCVVLSKDIPFYV